MAYIYQKLSTKAEITHTLWLSSSTQKHAYTNMCAKDTHKNVPKTNRKSQSLEAT